MTSILIIGEKSGDPISLKSIIQDILPESTFFSASDSHSGIILAIQENPEVIILGELGKMPDRFEFCRHLKQDERLQDIPVIFLININDPKEIRQKALEAGIDTFLHYPFDEIELEVQLRAMIRVKMANQLQQTAQYLPNKDYTKPMLAEIDLQKSKNIIHGLIEHLPHSIFIKDRNSIYISCNEKYANDLGITPEQISGKDDFDFYPKDLANNYRNDDRDVITNHKTKTVEEKYISNGEERWIHTIKVPFHNPNGEIIGVFGIFEDITERKNNEDELVLYREKLLQLVEERTKALTQEINLRIQTENALRESENKYRNIVDYSTSIVLEWDTEGNIVFLNKYGLEFFGFAPEEILGRNVLGTIVEPQDSAGYDLEEKMQVVKQHPEDFYSSENENVKKNGEKVWIAWTNKGIRNDNGQLIKTLSVGIDRTKQREAEKSLLDYHNHLEEMVEQRTAELTAINKQLIEEIKGRKQIGYKLQKANRLYAVISQVNQTIVYTKDKDQLFREICRIAIEFGKFQMAWVGLVDEKEKVIVPKAFAGFEDGYLSTIKKISAKDIPEGHGPTGSAIREGKHFVCADYQNNPAVSIWRDEALKRGYRSSISLPITMFGKAIGAFTLYANTPDFFDEHEIRLLTEVADDISFALDTFDIEQKHREAEKALAKSESQFRGIFDNLQDAFFQVDSSGKITLVSPSAIRMYGYSSEEELIGMPATITYANEEDREKIIKDLLKKGNTQDCICQGKRKDGSKFWASMNAQMQFDENGKYICTDGVVRDITERMKADEDVRQAKERFQTMFEQAPVGMTLSNSPNDELLEINKKFAEIVGHEKEEIKALGWMKITHPEDLQNDINNVARMNAGEIDGYQMKKRYVRADGSVAWVNMTIAKINTEDKGWPQNLCMVEDITDRKNDEDKIRILSRAVEQSPATIVITDTKGNIEYVNPKFTQTSGYTSEEAIGKNQKILKPETNASEEYNQMWETITHGNEWHGEFRNHKKNGEIYYERASISPVSDENGNISNFIAIKEDITDRKKVEEQIKTLSAVVEQSPSMIIITDQNGKIEFINTEFSSFMQYSAEEIIGKKPWIFNPAHHQSQESYETMWETLRKGQVWQSEFRNRKKDKTYFWEAITIYPLIDASGSTTNYIINNNNITEKKQLLDDLVVAKEKAEESDRLKSAFLANMSHEIRTPLNSIIGFANLLFDPFFEPEQQFEFVKSITKNGDNLLVIINDIMDISKIESGQIKILRHKFSVNDLIFAVRQESILKANEKAIEFKLDLPDPVTTVYVENDEARIKQILTNFVNNSIKFTETGFIEIGLKVFEDTVQIHVKDTGIGIPKEFHQTVFERFRQVESANTRKYGGNGLGLTISKQLADLLGCQLRMESEPGKGSTFYLALPK